MTIRRRIGTCALLAAALLMTAATSSLAENSAAAPYDQSFVTQHTGVFGNETLSYTATVESTVLTDDSGKPAANFVSTSYELNGVKDPGKRPVIFAYAGGPSGASTAYHSYLLGPKRIVDPEPGRAGAGRTVIDNPDWLLDIADIVMVDPAETGFSRILPDGKRDYFYNINGDTASIEQFIGRWLKKHHREASPLYVMGGSYGSVRSIRIAWDLRKTAHPVAGFFITANCAMLQETTPPFPIGFATALPSQEMTAIYHHKVEHGPLSDKQLLDDAYDFATNEYLPALSRVQDLTPAQRSAMADKLSARTGISADVYLANDLAITTKQYMDTLLQDRGLVIATTNDGRATRPAGTPAREDLGALDLFRAYMRDDLKVTYPMSDYRGEAPNTENWGYDGPKDAKRWDGGNDWPKMVRETLGADPKTRMLSFNGYYDNQCPYSEARYLFSRTKLPKDQYEVHEYPGPHGLYMVPSTASHITDDIRRTIKAQGY
ncbi:MAG TPA: hypothetical protein VG407_13600 [Caulobacteraceae bacterium]|jgi:carboxypeptidase C (cathepsin A)|nr:hypothetical protein [Caulobacteraceae bacterium]